MQLQGWSLISRSMVPYYDRQKRKKETIISMETIIAMLVTMRQEKDHEKAEQGRKDTGAEMPRRGTKPKRLKKRREKFG